MRTHKNKISFVMLLAVSVITVLTLSSAFGDDLNPPPYRGDPLSVYAHWSADASGLLSLDTISWVDDADPSTYLHPIQPSIDIVPGTSGIYQLQLPNFVDELPIKFLRLQLTWVGVTAPPIQVFSEGLDGVNLIQGIITFASNPLVFTQPSGGYQYFDFEYKPNPDFERIHVQLAADASLVQVVVDSVSTVPEPAAIIMMALGSIALFRKR